MKCIEYEGINLFDIVLWKTKNVRMDYCMFIVKINFMDEVGLMSIAIQYILNHWFQRTKFVEN